MPFKTRTVRLGALVDDGVLAISDGYRVRNDELGPSGIPFVRGGDIRDGWIDTYTVDHIRPEFAHRVQNKLARAGDVAFIIKGTVGRAGRLRAGQPAVVFAPQVAYWRVLNHEVLDATFLYYLTRTQEFQAALDAVKTHGSMVADYVSISQQLDFSFQFPDIDHQREIGATLGALDDRISLLRQTNATLESIAQALFKSWFIDFDPVRAKAEGREPEGMDAATAALFPGEFNELAHGAIPKGWRPSVLGELFELTKGCSYKGDGLSESEGAHMFNLGCFNAHRVFATEKVKRYTGEYKSRHEVEPGDLIIANTDMTQARDILGRPAFVPDGFKPGFVSHHVFKATMKTRDPEQAKAMRAYVFFALQQDAFRERAIGFATGTTVLALPAAAVLKSPCCLPPNVLLEAFSGVVRPVLQRIRENEKISTTLTKVRDALLPYLISGKLRLPEAQEQLVDALA